MKEKIKKIFINKHFLIFACLFFIAFASFFINLNDNFLSDDWDFLYLAKNNQKNVFSYFGTNYLGSHDGGSYRPILNIFWFSFFDLFNLKTFPYHFFNLLLHVSNAFLLYFLILKIKFFKDLKQKNSLAILTAILFILLPSKSEVLVWTAAIGDSLMTLFFLLSFLFFILEENILVKNFKKNIFYILSLVFFAFSIFTKEMALCLPFIIGLYLLFDLKKDFKKISYSFLKILPFFLLLSLFFYFRYRATGLFLADYRDEIDTKINFTALINSQISFLVSMFFSSVWRVKITLFLINYKVIFISLILFLFVFVYKKDKNYFKNLLFLFFAYLFSTLAIYRFLLDLNINYISEEGSRWIYLPSVFFFFLFVYLFLFFSRNLTKNIKILSYVFLSIFYLFLAWQLISNNLIWRQASKISEKIILDTEKILEENKYDGVVLLGLPDNYHGAYIFRNNFKEALKIKTGLKPDMIIIKFRTLFDFKNKFVVEKLNKDEMIFVEENKNRNIIAEKEFFSVDYDFKLLDPFKNNYASSYIYSANKLYIKFNEEFLLTNKDRNILFLYIDNDEVKIYPDFFDIYE
jgi:hypothetical protein